MFQCQDVGRDDLLGNHHLLEKVIEQRRAVELLVQEAALGYSTLLWLLQLQLNLPLERESAGSGATPWRWSRKALADRSALNGTGLGAVTGTVMERVSPYLALHWMQLKGASSWLPPYSVMLPPVDLHM